jgi:hypothetical protein
MKDNEVAAPPNPVSDAQVGLLRDTVVALVRRDGADLSVRQLGVFLTCYLNDGGHTVRGLAAELNVSKPAITRALDRLGELAHLIHRTRPDKQYCHMGTTVFMPPPCWLDRVSDHICQA